MLAMQKKIDKRILLGLFGLVTMTVSACSGDFQMRRLDLSSAADPSENSSMMPANNPPSSQVLPLEKTVSVCHFGQIGQTMMALTGLRQPSAPITALINEFKVLYSADGKSASMTGVQLRMIVQLAAETCTESVRLETLAAVDSRRLFKGLDLLSRPLQFIGPQGQTVAKNLAKYFWLNRFTDQEIAEVVDGVQSIQSLSTKTTDADRVKESAVSMCTIMLSSLRAIEC